MSWMRWTGPRDSDLTCGGTELIRPVPPERWPYGPPEAHQDCCILHEGGRYCDCTLSTADEGELDGWDPRAEALRGTR